MAKGKLRRFVLVFDQPTLVVGTKHNNYLASTYGEQARRKRKIATRTARGPVEAYRLATGWTGLIYKSKGNSPQTPAAQVKAYVPRGTSSMRAWLRKVKEGNAPPMAYVLPLGEW